MMGFDYEARFSDSPYLETVTRGRTVGNGSTIRPAENHWHMVLVKWNGGVQLLVVGPLTEAGVVSYTEGVEILWIKFRLGVFMPHLPITTIRDAETILPSAASRSFWLQGSAWQYPDFENVETFANRLARQDMLVVDTLVRNPGQARRSEIAPRTVRHRFLHSTGLTQNHIFQVERAQQAASLLQRGVSILDSVHELGYYDQPHLTRALKQFVGYTPGEIVQMGTQA
jgi:hypothetical protein